MNFTEKPINIRSQHPNTAEKYSELFGGTQTILIKNQTKIGKDKVISLTLIYRIRTDTKYVFLSTIHDAFLSNKEGEELRKQILDKIVTAFERFSVTFNKSKRGTNLNNHILVKAYADMIDLEIEKILN